MRTLQRLLESQLSLLRVMCKSQCKEDRVQPASLSTTALADTISTVLQRPGAPLEALLALTNVFCRQCTTDQLTRADEPCRANADLWGEPCESLLGA